MKKGKKSKSMMGMDVGIPTNGASAVIDYLNREAHGNPKGSGPYSEKALKAEMDGATFDLGNLKHMVKMRKKGNYKKKVKDCGCK